MTFTSYSSKATASRGFERHFPRHDAAPYLEQIGGKWGFDADRVATTGEIEAMVAELEEADMPTDLSAPEHQLDAPVEDELVLVQEEVLPVVHPIPPAPCEAEKALAVTDMSGEDVGKALASRHKSQVEGAVKHCWDFFTANPDLRRKDAVAGAVATGVAFYTARTQYQKWFAARRAED